MLGIVFDAFNAYLGNAIGEFVGEMALYGSIAAFAMVMHQAGARRMATFAAITAIAGWTSMFRNMTSLVQPAADITNVLLPAFLTVFGVWLGFMFAPSRR